MSVIVGNRADPHVQAVLAACRVDVAVVDAASILVGHVTVRREAVDVGDFRLLPSPGWLRRLAPEGWSRGLVDPGVSGVSASAAVSALAAIARDERFDWLTPLDALGGAENKPFQYRRAAAVGVPVPPWLVTTDPAEVPTEGEWVAKPLGPGSFIDEDGVGRVVPTMVVDVSERDTIAKVPFVLQRLVRAAVHARVVTVADRAWSSTLNADGLPLDWRTSREAHHSFSAVAVPDRVTSAALAAARSVGVRYSAQDWIQDTHGRWWMVDLNPAGQWLFLPAEVSVPVTAAIAEHLDGRQ